DGRGIEREHEAILEALLTEPLDGFTGWQGLDVIGHGIPRGGTMGRTIPPHHGTAGTSGHGEGSVTGITPEVKVGAVSSDSMIIFSSFRSETKDRCDSNSVHDSCS